MAIPQGRLSTIPVPGAIGVPDNRVFYALINYEVGPIAIGDTTEGLKYQNWTLTWNPATFELIATPETTGLPQTIVTVENLISITFTFDQSGRISITWTTDTSAFLYWYDTADGQTVITDLGSDVITPAILLDDKRATQSSLNDMLLWYTKPDGAGKYKLYMKVQRERFLTEYEMAADLTEQYIHNIGMNNSLRVQITLKDTIPNVPYIPI